MYDIIIIGAGSAGISAYKAAIQHSSNILIINHGPWDTTCARVGCMPSKVLISTANRMHDILHAEELALYPEQPIHLDRSKVMQRVQQLRDRFTQATVQDVLAWEEHSKVSGFARFIDAQTVEVQQAHGARKQFQAKSFILAVGSSPFVEAEWKQQLQDKLITSDQIFELKQLPQRLAVIGSGVIALELAQAMQRLGVEITVFARSNKVGALSSPDLEKLVREYFVTTLNIKLHTQPDHLQRVADHVQLDYTEHGQQKSLDVDYVLAAAGRKSNLDHLDLYKINPAFNDLKNLPINLQTKQLGHYPIFVVGDAYSARPIQHEAALDGRAVVENCFNYPHLKNIDVHTPLAIVFTSPEMATVGQSYRALKQQDIDFIIGKVSYQRQGRALVLAKNIGAVEIYVDRHSGIILGAELFVEAAEHFAHLLCWCISDKRTVTDVLNKPFYHPTLEEGLRTALRDAARQLNQH
ncbi:dihydrolipoyl dehydrogenase [Acinetobacter larvae]|uniref:Dihydrolipoyl dehydrogenase n=1 Tax=Acinetobacter larvae TaxID=1789224 RepID=A0A1B2M1R0_9GAMM|nr:dihydrolipoyl dehydrogenase [Acinetobacter larvae]AOA59137.1 dihydrolipoyl dehydrogenase [Acinetobacter larvae]